MSPSIAGVRRHGKACRNCIAPPIYQPRNRTCLRCSRHGLEDTIGYECSRCAGRERFDKAMMLATYGDKDIIEILAVMRKGCPRDGNTQICDLCGAMLILPEGY